MAQRTVATPAGNLASAVDPGRVWRVGYRPDPWAWTPWQYAGETGHFTGRWDDPRGSFRTVYVPATWWPASLRFWPGFAPTRCLKRIWRASTRITTTPPSTPSQRPGVVPVDWLSAREASRGTLSGVYCAVSDKKSLATPRAIFLPSALGHGLADLDAGVLRLSAPRALTQSIAAWLYDLHDGSRELFNGVQFESRHGDDLTLWAVFERDDDHAVSARITGPRTVPLHTEHPDLLEAFRLHRLAWAD